MFDAANIILISEYVLLIQALGGTFLSTLTQST
jgi:hypothetical protein